MKKYVFIISVLILAVIALTIMTATQGKKQAKAKIAVIDNIMGRTSVRAYKERQVEDEKIEILLRAAMAAPSAANKQPWRFVVIRDKDTLKEIADSLHTMRMAAEAPLAIAVCGDMNATLPDDGLDYWVEDASAATENMLLAAHDIGLGAVWCGVYPMKDRVAYVSRLLNLPSYIIPLNIVPIGYPAENPEPKDKWDASKIHYEEWGGQ